MKIARGERPQTIDRPVSVEISREEIIAILGGAIKRKFGVERLRFEDVAILGNSDMRFEGVILKGIETLAIPWTVTPVQPLPAPEPEVPEATPPVNTEPVIIA